MKILIKWNISKQCFVQNKFIFYFTKLCWFPDLDFFLWKKSFKKVVNGLIILLVFVEQKYCATQWPFGFKMEQSILYRLAASLQDRIFNGHSGSSSSATDEFNKNVPVSQAPQLPSHSSNVNNVPYEVKTEPGVHLKRSSSPGSVAKLPYKKQCTATDYNEGNFWIYFD